MLLKKRKHKLKLPIVEVNIVSLMDIITTLLFFLILILGVTNYSILQASALSLGISSKKDNKPTFSLKVSLIHHRKAILHLGPIKGLKMIKATSFRRYMRKKFSGNPQKGYSKVLYGKNSNSLIKNIQKSLVRMKKAFPHEMKAVAVFSDKVKYQKFIDMVGAIRTLGPASKPFPLTNLIGQKEKTKVLFPEVIVSEWNEGA